jgi:hypothetical protein
MPGRIGVARTNLSSVKFSCRESAERAAWGCLLQPEDHAGVWKFPAVRVAAIPPKGWLKLNDGRLCEDSEALLKTPWESGSQRQMEACVRMWNCAPKSIPIWEPRLVRFH